MSLRKFGALLFACALVAFIPAGAAEAATLRQVFEAVNQAVVVVRTESSAPAPKGGWTSDEGLGSGVLVSADGKVMTAAHVVQTADRIEVLFSDGQRSPARVVSSLVRADVALLQLERLPRGMGIPSGDIQVLTPTRKGESGTFALNERLQQVLNPPAPGKKRKNFWRNCVPGGRSGDANPEQL